MLGWKVGEREERRLIKGMLWMVTYRKSGEKDGGGKSGREVDKMDVVAKGGQRK